jgi:hypothetical protein
MRFDYKTFCIDCFAHHAEDGDCSAQAKSTRRPTATPAKRTTRATSNSFVGETDLILCAKAWAIEWRDENWD